MAVKSWAKAINSTPMTTRKTSGECPLSGGESVG